MRPANSVRGLLACIAGAAAAAILMVGVIGTTAAVLANRSVEKLIAELNPAVTANLKVEQNLYAASSALRGWAIAEDTAELETSRRLLAEVAVERAPLDRYAEGRPELQAQLAEARAAVEHWKRDYLRPRIARGGGPGTFDRKLYIVGLECFAEIQAANQSVQALLDRDYQAALDRAKASQTATVVMLIVATLGGAVLVGATGSWASSRVRRPLAHLEQVARRLAAGESDVRALPRGPREIRWVGAALNDLADQSERAQAVESEFQANLRVSDVARSDFVSNVSHELRTPLTLITGYLELLADDKAGTLTAEQDNMVMVARRNVMRLRELIEDLLTLNRAEQVEVDLSPADLRPLVRDAGEEMQFAASRQEVAFALDLPPHPVVVMAEGGQLRRAIINLVSNAVKFSHAGGVVRLSLTSDADNAVISVRDQGMGIPQEDLARLGGRFFRGSNAVQREITGTGLGLRIVQTIVMTHQGFLSIDSEEGVGTEARIVLPLRPSPADDATVAPEA